MRNGVYGCFWMSMDVALLGEVDGVTGEKLCGSAVVCQLGGEQAGGISSDWWCW